MENEWPENDPYFARIADQCGRLGISREQWEAHQRADAERDARDPKAPTWGLVLLYPVAAFAIWIGLLSRPSPQVCETAQWVLTAIGGIWIIWVSVRLLLRERHRYQIWVHYLLGASAFVGAVVVMFPLTGSDLWNGWLLTMGDPRQCQSADRARLSRGLQAYGEATGDPDLMRQVARALKEFVREGCISIADLEKRKLQIEQEQR